MIYSFFPATTATPEMDFVLPEIVMVWPWAIEQLSPLKMAHDIPKVGSLGDSYAHGCLSRRAVEWEFLYVVLGMGRPGTNSPGVDHAASYGPPQCRIRG